MGKGFFLSAKKCIGILIAVALMLSTVITPMAASPVGDLNGDDTVSAPDLVTLKTVIMTGDRDMAYDVNGDGVINVLDLVRLKKMLALAKTEVTVPVEAVDGKVPEGGVTLAGGGVSAFVPAGVLLEEGVKELKLTVIPLTSSGIPAEEGETVTSYDVHISGISKENTIPVIIDLGAVMPKFLNMGNYKIYHVENGENVLMTLVSSREELTAHNQFTYEPETGKVTVAMATFSELAMFADTVNAWNGYNADFSWYDSTKTELTIANADQLATLSAIVGGMAKDENEEVILDSFADKTIKLLSNINLGDDEENNDADKIFYPIGYYNDEGTYEKTETAITSGFYTFEGTFDGNGHTISNIYQNTWEMKGDNNYYDATLQYYRDGMGLFGKVYGGTVKNLTVDNFTSDGEYTTTGVIAAYAEGATFENISITNCNPRVYNIGNGGIVGCVGWYAKEAGLKTTFKNITVDNSNKISALWGSWDVACGGIVGQYYPTSGQTSAGSPVNAGIHFDNCHVSAQMDVYNDVCANYQYYAYRYTGMMIGSIRENETIDGHVYPKMAGITASGCTVNFGDWNDYYYCELVANSLASYTHDHQFSRLQQVDSVDVENKTVTVGGNTTPISTSGSYNYVVVNENGHATENATCYHFVDGNVHNHKDYNGDGVDDYETVDGEKVLVEDKQHIYLEFKNLFTGYGWGVTSKGLSDFKGIETDIKIEEGEQEESVEKFTSSINSLENNKEYTIGEIFIAAGAAVDIIDEDVQVFVSPVITDGVSSGVTGTYNANPTDWKQGTLTLSGIGAATITITDYYFCTPTTIEVTVTERQAVEKFETKFTGDFLYRVGNADKSTVKLDNLFKESGKGTVGTVVVDFETVSGNASGTYTSNATWTQGTIQFSGTGVVKVTITDNDYCTPTELYLEVVDAVNATSATSATANNVVLLNDIGSGFNVSGNYTVFGNGFTLNYTGNGQYLNNGLRQGVVNVSENGKLDNLRIKATIYPSAYMYYGTTSLGEYVQGGPSSVEGDKTRYHYQLSAVVAKGSATISNCYIYGGRTNIFVDTGDVTIKDSVLECGVVANVQIQSTSEYTVTLEDVTTIQYQTNATIGETANVMLGAGVLVGPDKETNPKIVLNGTFKQYNWVTEDDANAVSGETAKMIINGALGATDFNHTINGKTASNLGIIYMNTADVDVENNTGLPYKEESVEMEFDGTPVNGKAYSLQGATEEQIYSDYENADRTTVNGDYIPTFDFDLGEQEISYDGSEDTRYLYGDANGVTALYQDGDAALTLDLSKIATIYKYTGLNYTYTAVCKNSSGNALTATNNVVTLSAQDSYTLEFTVEDNIFYDKYGNKIDKSVTRTFKVPLTLTVKEADVKNAELNITKTALDGVYTTVNVTDYKLRINFLDCISVTDYDNTGKGTTVDLNSNISSATLTPSGVNVFTTASTITITYTDGRVLTVNLSKISGSSAGTKTAIVNTSGGVYFITDGALDNKPTEESSQNKCTITSVSYKGNSGSTVTDDTDVTVTWELGGSSSGGGCVTGDTLVTLADGTKKMVKDVTSSDLLLVWDFFSGDYAVVPAVVIINHGTDYWDVISLAFNDGTVVNAVTAHAFFDADLNKFVLITPENIQDYLGHSFIKATDSGYTTVKLVDFTVESKYTDSYSLVSALHHNFITEDIFSLTNLVPDLFAGLEVGENLKYDEEKLKADIEEYGVYTYEDFAAYVTEEQFNAFNGAYMKISVAKGYITYDEIVDLIIHFVND